jgi:hypothetical protein
MPLWNLKAVFCGKERACAIFSKRWSRLDDEENGKRMECRISSQNKRLFNSKKPRKLSGKKRTAKTEAGTG